MADNFQSFKVGANELSSSAKFDNFVQAVEDAVNDLGVDQLDTNSGNNGKVITTVAGVAAWADPDTIPYGTTLPASPTDGDLAVLVDSTTAPTYQWLFRYNGSSSNADKWEAVGPVAAYVGVQDESVEETTASSTYTALGTAGPSFVIPRQGFYDVEEGFTGGGSSAFICMSYDVENTTIGTFTVTIASPAVFSRTAHGLVAGDIVSFTTTGALPTGLTANTPYFVIATGLTADNFQVSTTRGGAAVNTSGSQSGTHTLIKGLAAIDADAVRAPNAGLADPLISVSRVKRRYLPACTLTAKYRASGGTGSWSNRVLRVTPVRVS